MSDLPSFSSSVDSKNLESLKKRELNLREHELELLQLETKMKETYIEMKNWYDQCNKLLENSSIKDLNIPELPPSLKLAERRTSNPSELIKNIISDVNLDEDNSSTFPLLNNENIIIKKSENDINQAAESPKKQGLIEPLTKPPNEIEVLNNAKQTSENLGKRLFVKKNKNNKKLEEDDEEEEEENEENNNENDEKMRSYLSSSLGVSRGSLFDDTDIESNMDILNKIIEQSETQKRNFSQNKLQSTGSVIIETTPSELPRTRSTADLPRRKHPTEIKPKSTSSNGTIDHFPADIIRVSKKIIGLDDLLQPFRILKFKFAATVELPKIRQTSTRLNPFRLSKRSRATTQMELQNTKCLIILFDDVICICSEKKLEITLPINETWMESKPIVSGQDLFPFLLITPEKEIKCFLDQETKLKALKKIWKATLYARLDQDDKLMDNSTRILTYKYKNGDSFEGEWKKAKYNGKGILNLSSGDYYEGYFINGKKNGFGTLYNVNKQRYDGQWKNDQKEGKGTLYYPPSDTIRTKFVGFWKEGQQHGIGELYLKNGNTLFSTWKFGHPIYPSILSLDDRKTRYIGDLSESFKREGFGVCIYSSGDRYYGQWNNGEKYGKGFFITSKGTEYNGSWVNNQMEGQGTLCFASDETLITGKFSGDVSTSVVKIDGEFKLNRYDSSQTRLSTIQGYKWHCLFTLRLSNIEYIQDIQVLNENLANIISKNEEENLIISSLKGIFTSSIHPLGKLVLEFINLFKSMYHKPNQFFMQLSNAVDDIKSFLNLLSGSFISQFLKCEISHHICSIALQDVVFPEIYETIIIMYNISYEELNISASKNIKNILELSFNKQMAVCGVDKKYWKPVKEFVKSDIRLKALDLNPSEDKAPYQNALKVIRSMTGKHTVTEKLECVKIAASSVEYLLKQLVSQFGADEFLPMFCLVLLQAEIENLQSECNFMDDFMDENLKFNVYGYVLAQMQIAVGFFASCNISERLEANKLENAGH